MMVFRGGRYAVMCDVCFEVGATDVSADDIVEEVPLPRGWTGLRSQMAEGAVVNGELLIPRGHEAHGCPIHPMHIGAPGDAIRVSTATVTIA